MTAFSVYYTLQPLFHSLLTLECHKPCHFIILLFLGLHDFYVAFLQFFSSQRSTSFQLDLSRDFGAVYPIPCRVIQQPHSHHTCAALLQFQSRFVVANEPKLLSSGPEMELKNFFTECAYSSARDGTAKPLMKVF